MPEIKLHLASEVHDLWLKTQEDLEAIGLPPPFWAFAWAGGQGLARFILDHPETVRGKSVLDFASGSGIVAIAAAMAGASHVIATDIDPWAKVALRLNAALNGVAISFSQENLIGHDVNVDVILAGDVFYDNSFAEPLVAWLGQLTKRGHLVIVGDPGRSYRPRENLSQLAVYEVPVSRDLEDSEVKRTVVWAFTSGPDQGLITQTPAS